MISCNLCPGWRPLGGLLLSAVIGIFGRGCNLADARPQNHVVTEIRVASRPMYHAGPLAFSPDGRTLALPKLADGRVELLALGTGAVEILPSPSEKEEAHARKVVFSKDGRFLAVEYMRRGITVWDLGGKKQLAHVPTNAREGVEDTAFTKGNRTLVVVYGGYADNGKGERGVFRWSCARWEIATGKRVGSVVFDPHLWFDALSPDGRYAVFQYHRKPGDGPEPPQALRGQNLYDVTTGEKLCAVDGGGAYTFSQDSTMLVAYGWDQLSAWEIPSGKRIRHLVFNPEHRGFDSHWVPALSPNKKVLAVRFLRGNQVALLSMQSGRVLDSFECCPPLMLCDTIRYSPDGRMLVTDTFVFNSHDEEVEPLLKFWKLPASFSPE